MQSSQNEAPEFVEQIPNPPIDCAAVLSDDALAAGGLVKVAAYMRSQSSANAARVRKAREKTADSGARQLNVVVPVAAHAAMKSIAKELQQGATLADVLAAAVAAQGKAPKEVPAAVPARQPEPLPVPVPKPALAPAAVPPLPLELAAARLSRLKGWRRLLARLLGLL